MKIFRFKAIRDASLWLLLVLGSVIAATAQAQAQAQNQIQSSSSSSVLSEGPQRTDDGPQSTDDQWRLDRFDSWQVDHDGRQTKDHHWRLQRGTGNNHEVVAMGNDANLAVGQQASQLVAIMGSATNAGDVERDVVSVMGNTRSTGSVGGDAVAVLGNTYVNGKVGKQVVAVLGDVELGPQAEVDGEVVSIGGTVTRDPAAIVRGNVQEVGIGAKLGGFGWLHPWIEHCLLYARPLAIAPGLGWAWMLAMISLLSYVLTAWLAPRSVERCVTTLEQHAGRCLLAAVAGAVLSPILLVLLVVTVIGILVVPFVSVALFCIGMFGKLVMLAWLGRRITRSSSDTAMGHVAVATLIGGLLVTVLYLIPVLGFIVYKLLGFVGFGVVIYTLLQGLQHRSQGAAAASPNSDASFSASAAPTAQQAETATPDTTSASATESVGKALDPGLPRATFWVRMGALLIDVLLVAVVLNLVYDSAHIMLLTLATYGALMWKFKGATIGGMVFHLHVVRVDGRPLDWPTVVVRALSCFLSLLPAGLGFIWIGIDSGKQAWHDKIAGTVVVRTAKGVSLV